MLLIKVLLFFCYCVSCKSVLLSLAPHSLRQAIQIKPIKKRKNLEGEKKGMESGEKKDSKRRKKTTDIKHHRHACDVCGRAFTRAGTCNRHKRTHTGEKPYACDVCGKAFIDSNGLIRHKRTHTGEKPYACDVCERCFARGDSLKRHKSTQHPKEKFYECKKCEQRFEDYLSWEWHEKKHSQDQCFPCLLCDESFAKGGMLHVHMQKYFTNRPLSVSCINRDCKKQFSDILELCFHCFTEHLNNPKLIDDLKIEFILFLKKLLKDKKVSDDKDSVKIFFKNNDNVLIKQLEIEFKNKKEYPLLEFVEIIRSFFLEDLLTLLLEVRWSIGNHIENENRGVAKSIPKKEVLLDNDPLFLLDLQEEKLSHQEFSLFLKIFLDVFYENPVPEQIIMILNKHVTDRSA